MTAMTVERPANVPADRVLDYDMWRLDPGGPEYHRVWERLRETNPPDILWTPRNEGHWIAVGGDAIDEVLRDYRRFSNHCIMVPKSVGQHITMLPTTLDPPEHKAFRSVLNASVSPSWVRASEGQFREIAIELTEAVLDQGHCEYREDYAEKLPIRIFFAMVELPVEDVPLLKHWADQLTRLTGDMTVDETMAKFHDYLRPFVEARMGGDGQDLISKVINAPVNGRAMRLDEALNLCSQVLHAGLDTVVTFLTFTMLFLARSPEHRRELAEHSDRIPRALDEIFRRFGIVTLTREVVSDIEYRGVQMKAGDMIIAPTALAGLDPAWNQCPARVDFARALPKHVAFGSGVHRCVGEFLARTEIRVSLEEWLKRIPEFWIAPDAKMHYSSGVNPFLNALPLVWDRSKTNRA